MTRDNQKIIKLQLEVERLRKSEKHYRKIIENDVQAGGDNFLTIIDLIPDGIYICDLKGVFIDGNKASEQIIGYKKEELIGKNFFKYNLLHPKDLSKAAKILAKLVQGESTGPDEFRVRKKDGTWVDVEILNSPSFLRDQKVVLGSVRDIT